MTDSFRPTVLRNKAWDALTGKWGQAALTSLLYYVAVFAVVGIVMLITMPVMVAAPKIGGLIYCILLLVACFAIYLIAIGYSFSFLDVSRGAPVETRTLLEPTKDYMRYLGGLLRVFVYVLLWSLLLYIPGIIKAISYSQTFFIMRENPEMSGEQAIQRSMDMMRGHKMDYFLFSLSYIGWVLLGYITFGVGLLFVMPYVVTGMGGFYDELKKDYEARQAFGAATA